MSLPHIISALSSLLSEDYMEAAGKPGKRVLLNETTSHFVLRRIQVSRAGARRGGDKSPHSGSY